MNIENSDLVRAKRIMLDALSKHAHPERAWETLLGAARAVDSLEPEGEGTFEPWVLNLVKFGPVHFVLELFYWITDGLESGTLSKNSLEHGEAVESFLGEKDGMLLALQRSTLAEVM